MDERIKRLTLLGLEGVVVFASSVVGFALVSASALEPVRYLVPLAYVAASVVLFWRAARSLSLADLFGLASVIAALSIASYEVLGFGFFPGLVKGMSPFDALHLQSIAFQFGVLPGWNLSLATLAWFLRRQTRPPAASA